MVIALACWIGLAATQVDPALPRELTLEEPAAKAAQDPTQERFPSAEPAHAQERPVIDLDWLELTPGVGFAVFSPKFRTDAAPSLAVRAHAPIPWLSPSSDPIGEYFGLYAEAAFTTIDRRLSPSVSHRRGVGSLYSLGVDYSFLRDGTWILVARAGLMYADYGGVADLKSGLGPEIGGTAGIQISSQMAITYSPEVLFGASGSLIFVNTLGLLIQF